MRKEMNRSRALAQMNEDIERGTASLAPPPPTESSKSTLLTRLGLV